jgi:hypothetical protein
VTNLLGKKKPVLPSLFVLSFWFLFRFCNFSQTGYHQQEDLAKFGYRPEMKVLFKKKLRILLWNVYRMFVIGGLGQINLGIINQSITHACLFQDRIWFVTRQSGRSITQKLNVTQKPQQQSE